MLLSLDFDSAGLAWGEVFPEERVSELLLLFAVVVPEALLSETPAWPVLLLRVASPDGLRLF